jgi:hypothetical protein
MSRDRTALKAITEKRLAEVAQQIAVTGTPVRQFVRPLKEVGLVTYLDDLEDEILEVYENWPGYPWDLRHQTLIQLSWECRSMGGGAELSIDAVALSTGQRLYIHYADFDGIGPYVLGVSAGAATPRDDRLFLQRCSLRTVRHSVFA